MKHPAFRGEVYIHVLPPSRRLMDGRYVEEGKEYKASIRFFRVMLKNFCYEGSELDPSEPEECFYGMHGLDTDWYPRNWINNGRDMAGLPLKGNWVCVVRIFGNVTRCEDKVVGLRRKVIAMRCVSNHATALDLMRTPMTGVVDWVLGRSTWRDRDSYIP